MRNRTTLRVPVGALLVLGALALVCTLRPAAADEGRDVRRSHVVKVVEKARDSIVSIRTNQIVTRTWYDIWNRPYHTEPYEQDGGLGSGVIFHPDGYAITNAHVISRASTIFVGVSTYDAYGRHLGSEEHRALPVAIDIANDLAILRLLPAEDGAGAPYNYSTLATSRDLMVGESVIAMGHPFRLGLTVTKGIVSGLDRKLAIRGQIFDDFMQVDAAINPGNSGGPLFDITGRWIGVNTAIYNRAFGAEGIGFAIPADRVRSLIGAAFKRRVVADDWLGLEFVEGPGGQAIVERVYPKGPAAPTDLRPKDLVVSANGKRVSTLSDLRLVLVSVPARSTVKLGVVRGAEGEAGDGEPLAVTIPLEPVPTDELSDRFFGFKAEDTGEKTGVIVTSIRPGSPAEKLLMRKDDVIFGLGHWKIRNTEDLLMFLQFVAPGDLVDVKIRRIDGRRRIPLDGKIRAE